MATLLLLAGCAAGPRAYTFRANQTRQATKFLNRAGSEAKPYVEGVCAGSESPSMKAFCRVTRALYRGVLTLADGIDDAMNAADAENKQAVDLDKVLQAGFKVLDLMTEEEATARLAMKGVQP